MRPSRNVRSNPPAPPSEHVPPPREEIREEVAPPPEPVEEVEYCLGDFEEMTHAELDAFAKNVLGMTFEGKMVKAAKVEAIWEAL